MEANLTTNSEKEQTASDEAFALICRLQSEACVNDVVDPSTFTQLKYLANTSSSLNKIFADIGLQLDDESRQGTKV